MDLEKHYNKIYTENESPFGEKPLPLIEELTDYLKEGDVLDIGAGEGRNSLYLAKQGFNVTAIDISSVAIENLNKKASEMEISLNTKLSDIRSIELNKEYDLIINTFVLQNIKRDEALDFINLAKAHTKKDGINVIFAFTKDGDFYKKDPSTNRFYLDENELKELYNDWKIIKYFEHERKSFAKRPDGTNAINVVAGLMAQKVVD